MEVSIRKRCAKKMEEWSESCNIAGFEDISGPRAKEWEQPLKDKKDMELDSSLEPLESNIALLASYFSRVIPMLDF